MSVCLQNPKSVVLHVKLKKKTLIKLHEREYRGDFYATVVHVYQKGFNLQQSTGFGWWWWWRNEWNEQMTCIEMWH